MVTSFLCFQSMAEASFFTVRSRSSIEFLFFSFSLFHTPRFRNVQKSAVMKLLAVGVLGHFAVNIVATASMLGVSHYNYPGGDAMHQIHQLVPPNAGKNLHLIWSMLLLLLFLYEVSSYNSFKGNNFF